jgi:O-Antigen ligase
VNWFSAVVLLLATSSALLFGGVYTWIWWPVVSLSLLAGAATVTTHASRIPRRVAVSAALILTAGSLQLLPIAAPALRALSPAADRLLLSYDLSYAGVGGTALPTHGLSIDPARTALALFGFAGYALLMLGVASAFTRQMVGQTIRGLLVLGLVMALIGVAQHAFYSGKIYGFWTPQPGANPFGPFVNRNHFAGWAVMTLPLGIGYLFGRVERAAATEMPDRRSRLVWFGSAEANQIILLVVALVFIAIALVLTMSRSGMLGFAGAVMSAALFVTKAAASRARKRAMIAFLVGVLVVSIGWVGINAVGMRFASGNASNFGGRLPVWADAVRIARAFPLTGTGINTYGTATLYYQTADPERHYAQAHNDYLQLLAEGGFLVAVPVLIALIMFSVTLAQRIHDTPAGTSAFWIRVGATCGLIGIAVQEAADFSLQIPANSLLFAVVAGIALRPLDSAAASHGTLRDAQRVRPTLS